MERNTKGIVFYMDGTKPLPEFLVAFHSLKKHNPYVNVHVVCGPSLPAYFLDIIKKVGISYTKWDEPPTSTKYIAGRAQYWCQKPMVLKQSPFSPTLYYDCDHLFFKPIPENIWSKIHTGVMSTGISKGLRIPTRRNFLVWRDAYNFWAGNLKINKSDYDSFYRVNGGCVGVQSSNIPMLDTWKKMIDFFFNEYPHKSKRLLSVGDESALAMIMNVNRQQWLGDDISRNYHPYETVNEIPKSTIAIHLSRGAYKAPDIRWMLWKKELNEAVSKNFLYSKKWINKYTL